jgi:ribosomal RNA-processing protein 9
VRIWKVEEGSQLVCRAKPRAVSLDAISMINDRTYLSGSENGSVSLWSVNKKKPIYNVRDAHSGNWITSTASLAHTDLVASGSSDGALRLWRVDLDDQYLEEVAHLGVPGFINDISFGSSGRILVAAIGREHRLGRWEKMKTSEAKNGIQIVRLPKF